MPGVSKEQIARAREIDLLTYLETYEPQELRRDGPGRYTTATHGSLVISRGKWIWNREGIGGVSALDYLIKVRGWGFVEAVEHLSGGRVVEETRSQPRRAPPVPQKRALVLPRPCRYASQAVVYLQDRGISPEVLGRCIQVGVLYEGRFDGKPVCVFVGKDDAGKPRFACMRGIGSDIKRDAAGSDKRFSFCMEAKSRGSPHLAVFEAPIDAMSYATLCQRDGLEKEAHLLSLGGTSDVALMAFLERNPHITRVNLCLDNDAAGHAAAHAIQVKLAEKYPLIQADVISPPEGKEDFNDALLHQINLERQTHSARREAGISR